MSECFNAILDHCLDQKARFAQKKSTILSGSKYASRTLRNDEMAYDDEEEFYSDE